MKTVNTKYHSKKSLENFLLENKFLVSDSILIQVFTGVLDENFILKLLDELNSILPNATIIGSSTDGEILDGCIYTTQTIISFTRFDNVVCKADYIEYNENKNIRDLSLELSKRIYQPNTKLIIAFVDGLNTDGEQFLKNITNDDNIIVSGGLAGDNSSFVKTFVFTKDKLLTNGAVAVSLSGEFNIYTDFSFNWEPIGQKLTVTSANDNTVYTIEDKTAYDTYKYYLGEDVAKRLPAIGIEFPLIIQRDDINIARAVTGVNSDGSLNFAGDLKVGDIVRFGYGNSELILNSAALIPEKLNNIPVESIFIYSCMARRRFMNHLATQELEPFNNFCTNSGFFTYGEFFSKNGEQKELLNQTMTILVLSESKEVEKRDLKVKMSVDDLHTVSTKALSHLINVTSNELHNINETLQKTLKREHKIMQKQEELISAQSKMATMGDMIGNIAHQWRQPLNTISVAMTAMQVQNDLKILTDEFFTDTTNKVVKNVEYLADTIAVFRNFLKEDKLINEYSLQSIIKHALEIVSPSLFDNQIKLVMNIEKNNINIKTIAGELMQVLINIINNAKDAILENNIKNGMITVSLYLDSKTIYLTIQDNAGGIPNDIISEIFKPYFTTKADDKGTGLGLHMSYEIIVNNMGGNLYVKNENDGAKFYIEFQLPH